MPNNTIPTGEPAWAHVPDDVLAPYRSVAVTGGAGFVGGHLVTALTQRGVPVRVLDLVPPRDQPGVEFRQVDLREPDGVTAALSGIALVFHIAGNASGTRSLLDPRFDFQMNSMSTVNIAQTCAKADIRMVYMSAASVYGPPKVTPTDETHPTDPILPYGASKLASEGVIRALVRSWGLNASIARPFVIYGPGEDPKTAEGEVSQFLRWHLNGRPVPAVGDVDAKRRDFVHVHDIVSGLMYIAGRAEAGVAMNIGSGTETSLRELVAIIERATGSAAELEADDTVLDDSFSLVGDITRLRSLGYQPRVPLADGVAALARDLGRDPELPATRSVFQRPRAAASA
jgi:UDP-glucose 4-epimerase